MENKSTQIQVFGTGCSTCAQLFELTKQIVKEMSLKVEVEYVTDIQKMVEMGLMSSPVLVVNGKPIMTGFTPNVEKIKKLIQKNI